MSKEDLNSKIIKAVIYIQIQINFKQTRQPLKLPIHYNRLIQGAIYNSIDAKLAEFLHGEGFTVNNRKFKMFAFSLLNGLYKMNKKEETITFTDEIKLTITSPVESFCQSLVNNLLIKGNLRLGSQELEVINIDFKKVHVKSEEIVLRTLSPIVFYSTFLRPDGRKYTAYFQPGDPDYERLLNENLRKKYYAFYDENPPLGKVNVKPKGMQKMRIIKYKNTIIKGYSGVLSLKGPLPLLQLAVDGGLGGKNSQGFGCVEVIGNC